MTISSRCSTKNGLISAGSMSMARRMMLVCAAKPQADAGDGSSDDRQHHDQESAAAAAWHPGILPTGRPRTSFNGQPHSHAVRRDARRGHRSAGPGAATTTALVLASNAPDIDIVTTARGGAAYLQWHRGPTHGPLGIVALGGGDGRDRLGRPALTDRQGDARPDEGRSATFGMLFAVSMVGVLCHILMDFPTSYGTRLLSPFSWHWFAADLMPIVDVYLIVASFAGLLFGQASEASRRRNAAIVLVLMAANYGVRAVARHEAIGLAPRVFGPLMPQPCDPARTDSGRFWRDGRATGRRDAAALAPQARPAGASPTSRPCRRFCRRSSGA